MTDYVQFTAEISECGVSTWTAEITSLYNLGGSCVTEQRSKYPSLGSTLVCSTSLFECDIDAADKSIKRFFVDIFLRHCYQ